MAWRHISVDTDVASRYKGDIRNGVTHMTKQPAYLSILSPRTIAWAKKLTLAQVELELSRRAYPYSFRDNVEVELYCALSDKRRAIKDGVPGWL